MLTAAPDLATTSTPAPQLAPAPVEPAPGAMAPADVAETAPALPPVPPTAAQRIASAALEDLSHVELVERVAIAMQRRQERDAKARSTPGLAPSLVASQGSPKLLEQDGTGPIPCQAPQSGAESDESDETEANLRAALASLRGLQ